MENKMIKEIQLIPQDRFVDKYDKYGDEYPNALVYLNNFSVPILQTYSSDIEKGCYIEENEVSSSVPLTYSVNFWSKAELKGKRPSRALKSEDGSFVFGLNFEEYRGVYNAFNGDHEEKLKHVIERHFRNVVLPALRE